MAENETTPETTTEMTTAGVLGQFADPEALVAAARGVREAGYTRWDCHSPFPVHGIDPAMGIRPTPLPWLVLGAGIVGAIVALLLQWWTNAVNYPHIISGKPLFSLPANIPVTFELIVLFSGITAFVGALALNNLPRWFHPLFSVARFRRVTSDGFFISIDSSDAKFDAAGTAELLSSLGATAVETCRESSAGARVPRVVVWGGAILVALAMLPPLVILIVRNTTSTSPRIHIISDMDFQPKFRAQNANPWFADGRAMRLPPEGTIADGQLRQDDDYWRGGLTRAEEAILDADRALDEPPKHLVSRFPERVSLDDDSMQRGRERFNIFCATCHGRSGDGDGMTMLRAFERDDGWAAPRSLADPTVRAMPVGKIFHTITHGVGTGPARTMPAYKWQIPVDDRWRIVLYVRALQRSQQATVVADEPEADENENQPEENDTQP